MNVSRDYPKYLSAEIQSAIRSHDLGEAARAFAALLSGRRDALELWAELLDELAHVGKGWSDWAEVWPDDESALEPGVSFLVLGVEALQDESFERASYYLLKCAELRPQSPVPLAYMGILYESQGCPVEALSYYQRCLQLAPNLFSMLNAVGNLYHELLFFEEAVSHYQRAYPLLNEPCNQAILLGNLGNSLRALGRLEEAIAAYTEAIALDPTHAHNPASLAETLLEARRTHDAAACLTDLLMMPSFDEWPPEIQTRHYGLLAQAHCDSSHYPACLVFSWLKAGARVNEEDRESVQALLKTLYRWAIAEPGHPVSNFLLAKFNRNLGYLDAALHHAKRALKLQPRAEHFIELGAALMLQGKREVALEAFDEAQAWDPLRPEIQSFKAMTHFESEPAEAEACLKEAMRLEPNQALHACDLAYLYVAGGDEEAAQQAFQRALLLWERAPVLYGPHGPASQRGCYSDVIDPFLAENANSPEAGSRLLTAANFLILSGRDEAARKALHRLLSEQPGNQDALRNYAWLLTRRGRHAEALSIWRKALKHVPDDEVSRFFALDCLARQGSEAKKQAIADLEARLTRNPAYYLGRLLLARLTEPDGSALAHWETLCLQIPDLYAPWYWRAQSLFHRRAFEQALCCLEKSLELNGRFARSHQLVAHCRRALGQLPEAHVAQGNFFLHSGQLRLARASYEEALALDAENREAHIGNEHIERLLDRLSDPQPGDLYALVNPRFRVG